MVTENTSNSSVIKENAQSGEDKDEDETIVIHGVQPYPDLNETEMRQLKKTTESFFITGVELVAGV